ncbi:MAG: pectinesterase family protein [Sedimentisphaerales bacterium]
MTITSVFPANNAVEVCADTKLWITFGTAPIVATDSNLHLQICRVSDNNVVYQLDLNTLPSDAYGHISTNWPYKINLNGRIVNYEPFAVSGNTVEIYPSTRLAYNTAYYVNMTAGFCTDANGNTSPEINDSTTWRFTTKASAPAADHDYTVALDGSGDFCTLQGAADAVSNSDPCRTLVKVKKGTYREIVNIPSNKTNMTWLGEDRDTTIMAAYNFEGFNSGNDYRMLIRTSANGFRMYNMTFHNLRPKAGGNNQAEITKHSSNQGMAVNCKYMSYQDTLCISAGQMYMRDCYIEGDTDYIWGAGTAYFDKCEMHSLSTKSHVTQPRAAAPPANGLFLVDCNLTAAPGITQCDLGRTTNDSYPYCQSVYINCTMPSTAFLPAGWTIASGTTTTNLRWWEYKSVDPCGNLIDVSGRVPYSKQLDDANALWWRDANNVFGTWNPQTLGELPTASWQPQPADGATGVAPEGISLTWAAGAEATSHMVYFGTTNPPEFVGEQTGTSFATGMLPDANYYWRVDEKNSVGTTTGTVWSFTTTYTCTDHIISDLDGDCQVDFFDYARLADAWAGNPPEVDLNNDGFLDYFDIAQFAIDWLKCNRDPASACWQ